MNPPRARATQAKIRELINKVLPQELSEEDWSFLVLQGQVAAVRERLGERAKQDEAVKAAARTIRNLRTARGEPDSDGAEPAGMMDPEEGWPRFTLSCLIAQEAEKGETVRSFRERHLTGYPDRKLEWEQVGDWIMQTAEADGPATQFALVALPPDSCEAASISLNLADPAMLTGSCEVTTRNLSYGLPGVRWVQHISVHAGGVLDELWGISEALVRGYGWKPDQAVVFVLCGITPYMPGLQLDAIYAGGCAAASRIRLTIDPLVPPREVTATYSRLRQRILQGRYRPLSEKHMRLALFAAQHKLPGVTWAEVMSLWNAEHEADTYAQETIFARDAVAARRRVLAPRLDPADFRQITAEEAERTD